MRESGVGINNAMGTAGERLRRGTDNRSLDIRWQVREDVWLRDGNYKKVESEEKRKCLDGLHMLRIAGQPWGGDGETNNPRADPQNKEGPACEQPASNTAYLRSEGAEENNFL